MDIQTTTWVENFLSNRVQQVEVNGSFSKINPVTSGIPQGSVLGPTLFVIYINDMPQSVMNEIYLFADDTKLYSVVNSDLDRMHLQDDLDRLYDWSNKWLLKFHPKKCKSISIPHKDEVNWSYHLYDDSGDRIDLERTQGEKDIGVLVVDKLNVQATHTTNTS